MYIKNYYYKINESKTAREYRKELKTISSIDLRKSSKMNVMGVIGALKVLENQTYYNNLSIYISSEYGCMEDMIKVLNQVNDPDDMVMPFDFLNINGNNTAYFISKAIDTKGSNLTTTSKDFSFEKNLEIAINDNLLNKNEEFILGCLDESLEAIPNYNEMIENLESKSINDGNCWFYITNEKEDSLAKIESLTFFENISKLNSYLETINFDKVSLNQFAKKHLNELSLNKELVIENSEDFFGTSSSIEVINLINNTTAKGVYIAVDAKQRVYLLEISK